MTLPTTRQRASRAAPRDFTTDACEAMLPLVRAIACELHERVEALVRIRALRRELRDARSPEGLTVARADAEADLLEGEDAILRACRELEQLGLWVEGLRPLAVHFPSRGPDAPALCWRAGRAGLVRV